jgi:hypothetical protein
MIGRETNGKSISRLSGADFGGFGRFAMAPLRHRFLKMPSSGRCRRGLRLGRQKITASQTNDGPERSDYPCGDDLVHRRAGRPRALTFLPPMRLQMFDLVATDFTALRHQNRADVLAVA